MKFMASKLFKQREVKQCAWHWPSCKQPRTASFRAAGDVYRTMNSAYFYAAAAAATPESSWFTNTPESSGSLSSESEELGGGWAALRSERFFFKPGDTKSIMEEAKGEGPEDDDDNDDCEVVMFNESSAVVMEMESKDPYVDFRESMEEMVEAHGLEDWECLEELLRCYLRVNSKKTHAFIVGAFVDLLVGLLSKPTFSSSSSTTTTTTSTTTTATSSTNLMNEES